MVSKAVNYNKLPSSIVVSLSTPLCVIRRSLTFKFVSPNVESYIPNQRQFSINFKGKVNINIWFKYPFSFKMDKNGVFGFYIKETSFWNSDHTNMVRVQWRSQKRHQYKKVVTYTTSHFQGFFKGSVKTSTNGTQVTRDAKIDSN